MIFYRLECLNEDGDIEENGYFIKKENAELSKKEIDGYKRNIRYGIKQNIIEIETED